MSAPESPALRRTMGLGDVVLFYVATTFSLRWIATAAGIGPSAITVWVLAGLAFFVPLAFCVLELSSRYPEEGGIYVWSKRAFGGQAGFLTGWTYWASNLPYLPSMLYFGAANLLFVGGPDWQPLAASRTYFLTISLLGLALAVAVNVVGLEFGKWLHNLGALGQWLPAVLLIGLGAVAASRFGPATEFTAAEMVPRAGLKDLIFWSTIAFAFAGMETASSLGGEIRDPRRTVPKALILAAVAITSVYVLGTVALLIALPAGEVSGLAGILQAIDAVARKVGIAGVVPWVAGLVALGALGAVGAWFAATARMPFVAGLDRYLPPAFGRLHPRWGTPATALLVQAAIAAVICLLGQAGTTVKGAYEVLVSLGIIAYFIPYLFLFAATIRLQREPAGQEVWRIPGGRPVATLLASVGFTTTAVSIVFATLPAADEPHPAFAVTKILGLTALLLATGLGLYWLGARRAAAAPE